MLGGQDRVHLKMALRRRTALVLMLLLLLVVVPAERKLWSWLVVRLGSFFLSELAEECGECLLFVLGQERREGHVCSRVGYRQVDEDVLMIDYNKAQGKERDRLVISE